MQRLPFLPSGSGSDCSSRLIFQLFNRRPLHAKCRGRAETLFERRQSFRASRYHTLLDGIGDELRSADTGLSGLGVEALQQSGIEGDERGDGFLRGCNVFGPGTPGRLPAPAQGGCEGLEGFLVDAAGQSIKRIEIILIGGFRHFTLAAGR